MRYLGVDTGGTFTDLVQIGADGKITFDKAFSTPRAPEQGVLDVIAQLARNQSEDLNNVLRETVKFAHGTTVSTNALIQRKGAKVGLLVTHGFEDTLVIGRGPLGRTGGLPLSRAMDFLHVPIPELLVPKHLTQGIHERMTVTGEVLARADPEEVRKLIGELLAAGIESLAVCLLWSFRNPAHELLVQEVARELAPDLPVSLSSDIAPRMGEFERTVTTVVNAFIGPITERYIRSLQDRLSAQGLAHPVQVMKSSGGVTLPERISTEAVSVVNSGPIGGLIAARHIGNLLGFDNIITADVGGTSFDVGIISNGVFEEQETPFIDQGLPVQVPAIKVVTIGAGGGSIAWTDGYRLLVGPQSAGAEPGPVCYGRGGQLPTVTDALVILGIINPASFFGGRHTLDAGAAERAIETHIAKPLRLSTLDAAAGIYEVITAKMADLIRKATVESGNDPRQFCLLSYGGAGGAHCAVFSAQLGIRKVVIPYAAPVFSALGCAFSDVVCTHLRSEPVRLANDPVTIAKVNATFAELKRRVLADMAAIGFGPDDIVVRLKIDLRYEGQMNEVSLAWDSDRLSVDEVGRLREAFDRLYEQKFGRGTTHKKSELELISFRAEGLKETVKPTIAPVFSNGSAAARHREIAFRKVYRRGVGWEDAAIHDFEQLIPGGLYRGPAIIERNNTTIWLPADSAAMLDVYGNIEIVQGEVGR